MFPAPPGAPQDLNSLNITNTTIGLIWKPPTMDGGRTDTFFNVFISTPAHPELVQNNQNPIKQTSFVVSGLTPNAFYLITVRSENGVSSQAGDKNGFLRSATTFETTDIGGEGEEQTCVQ